MKLLLDTSSFLWFILDAPDLSGPARSALRNPEHGAYLSAVSSWEIVLKHTLGKLHLPKEPARFIREYRLRHGISTLPLGEEAALVQHRLPPLHRDPFDRMLICQAIVEGMTIVTSDEWIRRYPVPTLW